MRSICAYRTLGTVTALLAASVAVGGCSGAPVPDANDTAPVLEATDAGGGGGSGGSTGAPGNGAGGASSGGSDDAGAPNGGNTGGGATEDAGSSGSGGDDAGSTSGSNARDAGTDAGAASGDASAAWDLTGWQLQLPIGSTDSPMMVDNPNGFSDAYFYVDTDGALTFMDPRTGVTTSGSLHPRSELREDTSGWPATGTNVMTATVAVPLVPQKVTIGQIFQAPNAPSKPLLELQYVAGGTIQVLLEDTNQGGSSTTPQVGTVTDTAQFDYTLSLSNNQIAVTINGKTTNLTLPSSFDGEKFYFKWGDYDQTATAGAQTTTPGTIVKFYAHSVSHS